MPFQHLTVHRNLLARPDPQAIPGLNLIQRHVLLSAIGSDAPRSLGGQPQQGPDGRPGSAARPQFQHLTDDHQCGNHRSGFEVDCHTPAVVPKRGREEIRKQRRHHTVAIGHADPQRNQGEHVQAAIDQGAIGPGEEKRAGPGHHRRGQRQLEPVPEAG